MQKVNTNGREVRAIVGTESICSLRCNDFERHASLHSCDLGSMKWPLMSTKIDEDCLEVILRRTGRFVKRRTVMSSVCDGQRRNPSGKALRRIHHVMNYRRIVAELHNLILRSESLLEREHLEYELYVCTDTFL